MAVNRFDDQMRERVPKDYFLNEISKGNLTDCVILVGTEYEIKASNTFDLCKHVIINFPSRSLKSSKRIS